MSNTSTTLQPGQYVKDLVTGIEGYVDNIATYMYGTPRVCIQPKSLKDSKVPDSFTVDTPQVKILKAKRLVEKDAAPPRWEFGQKVRDPITGVEGVYFARAVFMNGCARVGLQPTKLDKDGKPLQGIWFEEAQLETVGRLKASRTEAEEKKARNTGGPWDKPQRQAGPTR